MLAAPGAVRYWQRRGASSPTATMPKVTIKMRTISTVIGEAPRAPRRYNDAVSARFRRDADPSPRICGACAFAFP